MKNLVLSALLFVGLLPATGCIISSGDDVTGDDTGDVAVSWQLLSSDAAGNPVASQCPTGADTIEIFAQRGNDTPFSDKFLCTDDGGIATLLPPAQYAVWIQITDHNGTVKFAESAAQLVNVGAGGTSNVAIDIFTDRAFFQASWVLTGRANSCAAAGADKVSILATVSGGANGFDDDKSNCVDGEGNSKSVLTTTPVPIGEAYTVVVAALNTSGESIGDSAALPNRQLTYGNQYDDLGVVTIPIR